MAVKLSQFKGIAPKIAPELLADGFGQIARNCKLDSGDIIPYPELLVVGNSGRTGDTKTIYPLRNPDTDEVVWLSWPTEVSVATPAFDPVVSEQRFYYTGDGAPKVSTYALATAFGPPYPGDYYQLGLPFPDEKLTTVAATFSAKDITSVARDAGGYVTFETSTAHNLRTGMVASIKGFTHYAGTYSRSGQTVTVTFNNHGIAAGSTLFITVTSGSATSGAYTISNVTANTFDYTDPNSGATSGSLKIDTRSYNTTNSEVIVVDATTFKMFLPGFEQAEYAATGAQVELSGQSSARSYVFTWYTPWGEESIASDPSDDLIIKEGQVVTISNIPSSPPAEPVKNFIRGVRLYRTLAGLRETEFFLIKTLWFPQNTATVQRVGTTVTVRMQEPHNFIEGDRFKLAGCTNTSINITDGIVDTVVDRYEFTFQSAGVAIALTADTTGVLYHDCSENPDVDAARYWGDGSFEFTDDFNSKFLTDILVTDEWNPPPEDLSGLAVIQNNILAGFVRNKLYMSEPNEPHAWPEANERTLDVEIVAIKALSGIGAVILTEKQPYILTGSNPANMTLQKVDTLYPCVSARGAVSMNYGVVFPTYEGLALYSASSGVRLATAPIYNGDEWVADYDPTTFVGVYYDNQYFASHSAGSIMFTYDPQGTGFFVDCDTTFTAAYNDAASGAVYLASGTEGNIYQWDAPGQPLQTAEWKSKVVGTQDFTNIGAVKIDAAFTDTTEVWEEYDVAWEDADLTWSAPNGLTFTVWADGVEIYSNEVYNKNVFRLPKGYRTDTYEFAVEGDIRIRSISLGQTPTSLERI